MPHLRRPATRRPTPAPSPGLRRLARAATFAGALLLLAAPSRSRADASGTWSRLHPVANPQQAFVGDPVQGGAYLIDATTGSDTGVWRITADGQWTEVPTTGPGPTGTRPLTALYDPMRPGLVVMDPSLARAWRLDGATWSVLPVAGAPLGLRGTLAFDTRRERILLFGGTADYASDLWACDVSGDTARWSPLPPGGPQPQPRAHSLVVYEPQRDRLVVAGGIGLFQGVVLGRADDTWEYSLDSGTWQPLAVIDSTCVGAGIVPGGDGVVDVARDRIVRVRVGCDARPVVSALAAGDAAWRPVGPSLAAPHLAGPPPVYDPLRDRLLLLGNTFTGTAVFAMDGATGAWSQLEPGWSRPNPRRAHAAAYEASLDAMLVTTGQGAAFPLDDTWALALDGPAWRVLPATAPPEPRRGAALVSLYPFPYALLAGGESTDFPVDRLLVTSGPARWTSAGVPPALRVRHAAASLSGSGLVLVHGGERPNLSGGRTVRGDTWLRDGSGWHAIHTLGRPPGRAGHTLTWDASRRRAILHGGDSTQVTGGVPRRVVYGDTWALNLADSAWTRLSNAGPARTGHSAVYDALRDRIVVYGGTTADGTLADDVWALSLADGAWTRLAPGRVPAGRTEHVAAYDPVRDRMVVHGGGVATTSTPARDTWLLDFGGGDARPLTSVAWTPPASAGTHAFATIAVMARAAAALDYGLQLGIEHASGAWAGTTRLAGGESDTLRWTVDLPDSVEGAITVLITTLSTGVPMPADTIRIASFVPRLVLGVRAAVVAGAGIHLAWPLGEADVRQATLYRRFAGGSWLPIATLAATGDSLAYVDTGVPAGVRAEYRLGFRTGGAELLRGTVAVDTPGTFDAVRAWPNPSHGVVSIAFTLGAVTPVRAELFDLAGRRVRESPARTLPAGTHVVTLGDVERIDAGLYFLRLQRGAEVITQRVCVVR